MNSITWCKLAAKLAIGTSLALCAAATPADSTSGVVKSGNGDWPQWRGAKRDNISTETGLLKTWPEGGPKIAWQVKGLGGGYSSVSVAGGKIFTMGDTDRSTSVIALDLTGKQLWTAKVGATGGGGGYPGPRCTPTVSESLVYALGDSGDLVCLAAEDGKEIWRASFKEMGGQMMSGWGYSESPTVDGDKVVVSPGGKNGTVVALDKKSGKVLWRTKDFTDPASYASLVPADIGGTHQYVVLTNADVAGIGADGALLWKAPRQGATAVIPTPIVKDNLVFVTSGYGVGCNCFQVDGSAGSFTAKEIYANKEMKVHHGGVICLGDYVYGASDPGILLCMSIKDGKVVWKDRSVGKGALAFADGQLYLRSEKSGDIALVEASPESYKEHGRLKQPDRTNLNAWAHPVIAGGKLYIRDQETLFCYDIKGK